MEQLQGLAHGLGGSWGPPGLSHSLAQGPETPLSCPMGWESHGDPLTCPMDWEGPGDSPDLSNGLAAPGVPLAYPMGWEVLGTPQVCPMGWEGPGTTQICPMGWHRVLGTPRPVPWAGRSWGPSNLSHGLTQGPGDPLACSMGWHRVLGTPRLIPWSGRVLRAQGSPGCELSSPNCA